MWTLDREHLQWWSAGRSAQAACIPFVCLALRRPKLYDNDTRIDRDRRPSDTAAAAAAAAGCWMLMTYVFLSIFLPVESSVSVVLDRSRLTLAALVVHGVNIP